MSQLSRKEREHQARRQDILTAAREVFALRGFAETTIEEIAEGAEFGKGTIYNYFNSKLDLFYTLIEDGIDVMIEIASQTAKENLSPVDKLKLLLKRQLDYFQENAGLFKIVTIEAECIEPDRIHGKVEKIRQNFFKIFADGIKQGLFKKTDPLKLSILYSGFIHACIFHYWKDVKKHVSLTDAEIDELSDLFLNGILAERK